MFEPIMIGMAKRTGMISEATMLTMMLVDVDDDCTTTVANIPIMRPASGFVSTTLLRNASDAYFPNINNRYITRA
jgi:hypothetical protein